MATHTIRYIGRMDPNTTNTVTYSVEWRQGDEWRPCLDHTPRHHSTPDAAIKMMEYAMTRTAGWPPISWRVTKHEITTIAETNA